MSKILIDRSTVEQALEALEVATNCLDGYYIPRGKTTLPEIEDAIIALKAALAEPVQEPSKFLDVVTYTGTGVNCAALAEPVQEPVAWDGTCMLGHCNSPAGCENSGECRAVERAHGIGGEE